jgi:hypothetical protein
MVSNRFVAHAVPAVNCRDKRHAFLSGRFVSVCENGLDELARESEGDLPPACAGAASVA